LETVHESARDIPVLDAVDVLVAGGGMSGFAAAVASARVGAKTILLERNGCLGGVATATMMANIGKRYLLASGEQVVRGIAAEVVERLVAAGGAHPNWRRHKSIAIDSERLKVVLIEMLDEAGATVLTHAVAARPLMTRDEVRGCFFESKSGRQAIPARNTIDATGELDLAIQTGAEIIEHPGNGSMLFKMTGIDVGRFVAFLGEDPEGFPDHCDRIEDYEHLKRMWEEDGVFFFGHHAGRRWRFLQDAVAAGKYRAEIPPTMHLDAMGMYSLGRGAVVINSTYCVFASPEEFNIRNLSRYELHQQQMCYYVGDFLRENVPGFEKGRVEHVGVDLGVRGIRYAKGRTLLRREHLHGPDGNVHFDDVIATTPAETAAAGAAGFSGHTCDLPFGAAVPAGVRNLLVGSAKSIYTEGTNKRLMRGISGCMIYGQATGAAAALASRDSIGAGELPVRELQKELLRQGVRLGDEPRLRKLDLN